MLQGEAKSSITKHKVKTILVVEDDAGNRELYDMLSKIATVLSDWWSTHETHGEAGIGLELT